MTSVSISPANASIENVNTDATMVSSKVFNFEVSISSLLKKMLVVTIAKGPASAKETVSRSKAGIKKIAGTRSKK